MVKERGIILFDGVCNLCNGIVQFILKRDQHDHFQFSSLQSNTSQNVLKQYHLSHNLETFVYVYQNKAFTKSSAALRVFRDLGGLWKLLYALIIVPKFMRDPIYNWIAKNRYKWFGKRNECMLPRPEYKHKFLD
ncbi:thiol-disulfide oxidoreductase DCC family protein [Piscibacillus halophilus]|uniref:Predicted thiol-disulfide oxidoreductase YuxK, DCC family n=1 Tax=Piscibacillus halophilus TaxID=571933 RepID=A0A1H9GZF8_9BACI|nr:thiol-disulfide oxidoreductase DCC family protein [Piscibacillus halophilus]SEQ55373.1 Predicted thiol-disulfide oxidoreductase YuxK, DCC family [Piscibacillus halophilus]